MKINAFCTVLIMLSTEDFCMRQYVGFSQIGSHYVK